MGKRRPKPQHDRAYEALRALLKALRLEAELTQAQLAQAFGRSHTFVHKCESGDRRIDPVEFARWSVACGVPPSDAMSRLIEKARIRP